MILFKNALRNDFMIKKNVLRHDFYYKNALRKDFTIKMHSERILL